MSNKSVSPSAIRLKTFYRLYESTTGIERLTVPKPFDKWVANYLTRYDNDQLVAVMRTYSPINVDDGYTCKPQGMQQSTMFLYEWGIGHSGIEWDIPGLVGGASIGIWHKNKKVTEYDGVFELSSRAIFLLEMNGYDCSEVIE